jgi:hypothetical protein
MNSVLILFPSHCLDWAGFALNTERKKAGVIENPQIALPVKCPTDAPVVLLDRSRRRFH